MNIINRNHILDQLNIIHICMIPPPKKKFLGWKTYNWCKTHTWRSYQRQQCTLDDHAIQSKPSEEAYSNHIVLLSFVMKVLLIEYLFRLQWRSSRWPCLSGSQMPLLCTTVTLWEPLKRAHVSSRLVPPRRTHDLQRCTPLHGNHRNKHDNNMRAEAACSVTPAQLTW